MYLTNPYDTTYGKVTDFSKIEKELKMYIGKSSVPQTGILQDPNKRVNEYRFLTALTQDESDVPQFLHPVIINNILGKNYCFVSCGPFVRKNSSSEIPTINDVAVVRDSTGFDLLKLRSILGTHWLSDKRQLREVSSYAGIIYSSVITDALSRIYMLDMAESNKLQAVCYFYFQSLFFSQEEFDESTRRRVAANTYSNLKIPPEIVMDFYEDFTEVGDLAYLVEKIKQIVKTIKLDRLTLAFLMNSVANCWIGFGSKETVAVSLEYPPFWIALVFSAITTKSFKNTTISNTCEKLKRRYPNADHFGRDILNIVKDYKPQQSLDVIYRLKNLERKDG